MPSDIKVGDLVRWNCFENVNEKVSIIIKKDRDLSPLTILEDGN